MAVVMTEGFDMYNGVGLNTGLEAAWLRTIHLGSNTASMVTGRYGGQAVRFTGIGLGGNWWTRTITAGLQTAVSIGFAFRISSPGTMVNAFETYHVGFTTGGAIQCGIKFMSSGAVSCVRPAEHYTQNPTLLGTSAPGLVVATAWHYLEVEIGSFHDSTGTMNVYLDGAPILALTALDNKTQSSANCDGISIHDITVSGVTMDFDDLYVVNSGTKLGERRIETLRPSADSTVQWTPNSGATNYSQVDDTTVDGDTTYVSSSTLNHRDLYTVSDLSTTPASIDCVTVVSFAYKTDAATRAIRNTIKSAAVDATGSDHYLASTYARHDEIYSTDPNTSSAWAAAGVNAILIGPKITI